MDGGTGRGRGWFYAPAVFYMNLLYFEPMDIYWKLILFLSVGHK